MGVISTARFILLMDSFAAQKRLDDVAKTEAAGAADANTMAKGASNNYDRVDAYTDDPDLQTALLRPARENFLVANADAQANNWAKTLLLALNSNVSGIDRYCQANDIRIAPQAKKVVEGCGFPALSYLSVFSPTVDPMGTYTVGGAFADGGTVDKTKYAPQRLTLYTVGATGAVDGTYHVSCKKYDGTVVVEDVVVAGLTPDATEILVGADATKRYWDVTNITVTGGNAGDVVKIKAATERAISTANL